MKRPFKLHHTFVSDAFLSSFMNIRPDGIINNLGSEKPETNMHLRSTCLHPLTCTQFMFIIGIGKIIKKKLRFIRVVTLFTHPFVVNIAEAL